MASEAPWLSLLATSERGGYLSSTFNVEVILLSDDRFKGMFKKNALSLDLLVMHDGGGIIPRGITPFPRGLMKADFIHVQVYIQGKYIPMIGRACVEDAIQRACHQNEFHPVRDYFASLPPWNGIPLLPTWLSTVFDADDTPLNRAIGTKLLVAAVRRIRCPGVKYDQIVIFEGEQNIGKSTAIAKLAGSESGFFTDHMPHNLASKDASQAMNGVWFIEFGEIDQIVRTEPETLKAFLSRPVERFRPPYEATILSCPRQCVFVGTTNKTDYLTDETGNRRFWPVWCNKADWMWVEDHRDLLWAEAIMREKMGEEIHISDADLLNAAKAEQAARLQGDAWDQRVQDIIASSVEVTIADVLERLQIPVERWGRREQLRVSKILRGLGWISASPEKHPETGKSVRMWRRPRPQ